MIVAFLGTGHMGAPMAHRLSNAGLTVNIWNRSARKAGGLGGRVHADPVDAVREAEVICACVTDGVVLEDLLFGRHRIADAIPNGALFVDFSTLGPDNAVRLSERLSQHKNVDWLDCPVSGGVAGAAAGSLTIFVGGTAVALETARPILTILANRITHVGPVGAGQAVKLCNQLIAAANLIAITEAFALGERLGVDISRLPTMLAGGFADSLPLQLFGPRMAAKSDPGPAVSEIRMMMKDIEAISRAANNSGASLPLHACISNRFQDAMDRDLGEEDLPALMQLYRCIPE